MNARVSLWTTAALLICGAASAGAQEREEFLFLLNPPAGPAFRGAVEVVWIPAPLQKYCLGKTLEHCVAIDYCLRTTNRDVSQCRNLTVDVTKVAKYPAGSWPRRVLAVTYFPAAAEIKGMGGLLQYFKSKPGTEFGRLSSQARFKAKIRVKRSADDDEFDLLEVMAVPGS